MVAPFPEIRHISAKSQFPMSEEVMRGVLWPPLFLKTDTPLVQVSEKSSGLPAKSDKSGSVSLETN